MGEIRLNPEESAAVSAERVRETLEKILASENFRSARGQRAFLRYVVEEVIAGRGHQIKEFVIGIEAFGRGESFDPRLDPIVRTQAAKLRARLAKYYETEGRDDLVRIEFRKGSYAPVFQKARLPEAPVVAPQETAPAVAALPPPVIEPAKTRSRLRPKAVSVSVAVALFALAGTGSAGLYALHSWWSERVLPADAPSIAVMPFVNLGGGQGQEFLSDGLTDEVRHSLRQIPGLQVVARDSASRFKGTPLNISAIGRRLHVRTVLVGSVQRDHEHLRVTVQLNSTAGNYHIWSGTYDRDSDDVRSVPAEIAGAVGSVLGLGAPAKATEALVRKQISPNPEAYRNYLKGLYFFNKLTTDSLKVAIHYLEQAIADDPSFARAYAALAHCYVMQPYVAAAPPPEVLPKIREAASRALELDSTLGEPHFDLAVSAEYEFDWKTAEAEFKKGLALTPSDVVGHLWYAKYLAIVGRRDEVLLHRKIAVELDPVSPYAAQAVAGYLSVMGRYDEAIQQFSSALALDPDFGLAHQGLGMAYLLKGMPVEAFDEFQKADRLMHGFRRRALLGWAYGVAGRTADAHRILNEFLDEASREPLPALAIAQIYIGLGDKDRAFEWLQKAVDQRDLEVTLQWDSPYEPLRSDPRFRDLLRRMKLG